MAYKNISDLFTIPALYSEISDSYAKLPYLYTKVPGVYAGICYFGIHSDSNVCGRFLVFRLRYVANDGLYAMHRQEGVGREGVCWSLIINLQLSFIDLLYNEN